jgi:hypothetical protein
MTLRLHSRLINQYPCIGVETGERETDVCVDEADFGGCDACVLEFHGGTFFTAQDDDVRTFDADRAGSAFHGFEGVFDLEDVAIGREDWEDVSGESWLSGR